MIFYCDTCDEFFDEGAILFGDDLTDVPCPICCMPLTLESTDGPGPYDTLEEKNL